MKKQAITVGYLVLVLTTLMSASCTSSSAPVIMDGGPARFVVNGDGTVTDTVTNLIWLEQAHCLEIPMTNADGRATWEEAMTAAGMLESGLCGLTDGSSQLDWRLPTKSEWDELVGLAKTNFCAAPVVPDIEGTGCCGTAPCAFFELQESSYWSSDDRGTGTAWAASLKNGIVTNFGKNSFFLVWPVRS